MQRQHFRGSHTTVQKQWSTYTHKMVKGKNKSMFNNRILAPHKHTDHKICVKGRGKYRKNNKGKHN